MSQIIPISVVQGGLKTFANTQSNKTAPYVQEFNSLAMGKNVSLTKVMELLEAALSLAEKVLDLMIKREPTQPTSGASTKGETKAGTSSASNELLWKPHSEKDKNLVVLTPNSYSAAVSSVRVLSASGERVLAVGTPSGTGNGGRAHFRFKKPGSAFPSGAVLEIKLNDGTVKRIPIAEPGKRLAKNGS